MTFLPRSAGQARAVRATDATEARVKEFLSNRGYRDVLFEPDGNIPPDFLLDKRIAVEARRLNQNYVSGKMKCGLESDGISVSRRLKKLFGSLGPPTQETSWLVHLWFRRPLERWKLLEPEVLDLLLEFRDSESHAPRSLAIGGGFRLDIRRAHRPHATFRLGEPD
jgi:hypothetical protein